MAANDPIETDRDDQIRTSPKKTGVGSIGILFVIGFASTVIGLATQTWALIIIGVVLVAVAVALLLRRPDGIRVWECTNCGWTFELEPSNVTHHRESIEYVCPHCGQHTVCIAVKHH